MKLSGYLVSNKFSTQWLVIFFFICDIYMALKAERYKTQNPGIF
jgi:hypothetical protein